ncbi:FLYWCH and MULE domain containing protein [Trichuris trichiura]|uniref:FLYWCH and MULE domain containing protein n=1 Tax=Trichuris trichiura TaxID=36087 RepID=A0A077ZFH3_TRITR|nr:FLYWCH and MULE domain containing protein [Trichuris trichiura]
MAKVLYSQRLKPVICYNGYCYHLHSFNANRERRYWRCIKRKICKARLTTGLDLKEITIITDGTDSHQHAACAEENAEEIGSSLKRCVREESAATLSEEHGEDSDDIGGEDVASIVPKRNRLSRMIDGRKKSRPLTNSARLEEIEIPVRLTVTSRGEPFLMHDSGIEDDKRVLLFCTDENLRYLSSSTMLFCDGMSATNSSQVAELFIVYGVLRDCPIPLLYAITTAKREDGYKYVYGKILGLAREKKLKVQPSLCMMDFQPANMNAIQEIFPKVWIKGCLFSFAQLLRQRISFLQLTSRYELLESSIRKCVSMLFALPFVPLEDVGEAFEHIAETAEEDLDDLINYFERLFVHGRPGKGERQPEPPKFPPETWNCYALVLSTEYEKDVVLKGWHEKFQTLFEAHQYSLCSLVEALKDEQRNNEQSIAEMLCKGAKKKPSAAAQYRKRHLQIRKLVTKYVQYKTKGRIDLYLTEIARQLEES